MVSRLLTPVLGCKVLHKRVCRVAVQDYSGDELALLPAMRRLVGDGWQCIHAFKEHQASTPMATTYGPVTYGHSLYFYLVNIKNPECRERVQENVHSMAPEDGLNCMELGLR